MREDLTSAQVAVQASHVALEAGFKFGAPEGCHLILLRVRNEEHLLRSIEQIEYESSIRFVVFYEPDYSVPGFTAACSEPVIDKRKAFRRLQLWK